jgi:CheY-like chemotaxis protein
MSCCSTLNAEDEWLRVAKQIRSEPGGQDILLVAITGWGQEADRVRSRAAGFDHHLVKPVDFDQLQQLLEEKQAALQGMGAHAAH